MSSDGGAAGRDAPATKRIGVIDIGSNSVRLVVFDGLRRAFLPMFNEKVTCGLGADLKDTGRLSDRGIESALVNLERFVAMARAMGVGKLHLFATAAVRDASDGPDFVVEVESRCGHRVRVLSGIEEALISALGVCAGFPAADGVMGDLGGGSLELVGLESGRSTEWATLPLGPLRFDATGKRQSKSLISEVDRQLDALPWLDDLHGRTFYAVGGAWRNLARVHMEQAGYPLHVLHGYAIPYAEARNLCRVVAGLGSRSLARISAISQRRAAILPYAALLLGRVLRRCRPRDLVLSAYGLREGFLFDMLPEPERLKDPLMTGVADFAGRENRFGDNGEALARWIEPLFQAEDDRDRQLRIAACHLSDFAWREHPDYRADQALERILHFPFVGIDHPGRAFVAHAVYVRYGGRAEGTDVIHSLVQGRPLARARLIGLALRLAYTLSAGAPLMLQASRLGVEKGRLILALPADGSMRIGEVVERRLQALAEAADLEIAPVTNSG